MLYPLPKFFDRLILPLFIINNIEVLIVDERAPMLLGYMRVSKADGSQMLDLQRDALLAAGVTSERLYEDLASGRHDARPGLTACVKALRDGDTLLVWKLDRLGRNLRHLVTLVEDLRQRQVGLKVLRLHRIMW